MLQKSNSLYTCFPFVGQDIWGLVHVTEVELIVHVCSFRRLRYKGACACYRSRTNSLYTCVTFVTRHISPISGYSLPSGVAVIAVVILG
jgi:hypothetical protein